MSTKSIATILASPSVRHDVSRPRRVCWHANAAATVHRLLAVVGTVCFAVSAPALDIQFIDIGSPPMQAEQLAAFEEAARLWEAEFWDPITVKVNISFANLDAGIVAQARSARTTHSYSNVLTALRVNAGRRIREGGVLADLPAGAGIQVRDTNGTRTALSVTMTTANAKALGLGTGLDQDYGEALPNNADASITYNTDNNTRYDYDRSDGIAVNGIDFVGVAIHELGHVLGFISLTDMQDNNPGFELYPSPLDFWRFTGTGAAHNLGTEVRRVTCGPAEYYDKVLNNYPFSWGMFCCCDTNCSITGVYGCQASHWRDRYHGPLMDPVVNLGFRMDIHDNTLHAIDYIGYERLLPPTVLWPRSLMPGYAQWWSPYPIPNIPAPQPGYPPLPNPPIPPFTINVGVVMGLNFDEDSAVLGLPRSGVGFAFFADTRTNTKPVLSPLPLNTNDFSQMIDVGPRAGLLPPTLQDFYFVSDRSNGIPFSARAAFSGAGAEYDASIGPNGGYRLTLAVDGEGDGVAGDVDGLLTVEVLADQGHIPNGQAQNVFPVISNRLDNAFIPYDLLALCGCDLSATETEPNSVPADATHLGLPGFITRRGTLPARDRDFYRFTVQPTNALAWITVDTGGKQSTVANTRNSYVTLLKADGSTVIEADDDDGCGNGCDSTLESGLASAIAGANLWAPGEYCVEVRADDTNQVLSPYRLLLTVTAGTIPAEVEPNDQTTTATKLVTRTLPTAVRSGVLSTTNDVDYYLVQVSDRTLLHVSADGDPARDGSGPNLIVSLLKPDGTVLFSADSSTDVGSPAPVAEGFGYVIPGAGTNYVRVSAGSGQKTGAYRLMVSACSVRTLPTLKLESISPTACSLSWPAQAEGFRLQLSSDLQTWIDAEGIIECADDLIKFSVMDGAGGARFFRLVCP